VNHWTLGGGLPEVLTGCGIGGLGVLGFAAVYAFFALSTERPR